MKDFVIHLLVTMLIVASTISAVGVAGVSPKADDYIGATLFVGGAGPGNYTTIQSAIDNASDGDTVFVYNGAYHPLSCIVVDKSICLTGENRDKTIVESQVYTELTIRSDYVSVSNFMFINVCVDNDHDYISINCNNFLDTTPQASQFGSAMIASGGSHNTIAENVCIFMNGTTIWNPLVGIDLQEYCSTISNNTITGGYIGLEIFDIAYYPESQRKGLNVIEGNTFSNNTCGLYLDSFPKRSYQEQIIRNNFIDNDVNARFSVIFPSVADGIRLLFSHACHLDKNLADIMKLDGSDELFSSYWDSNYWDDHLGPSPKIIKGSLQSEGLTNQFFLYAVPWVNFDWHPAEKPYNGS